MRRYLIERFNTETMTRTNPYRLAVFLASTFLLAFGCDSPVDSGDSSPDETPGQRLRVIATNDLHGHLRPTTLEWTGGREVGGAATIAAYIARAREETDAPVVLLDAGDILQGTFLSNLTHGRWVVEYFNHVGYTAVAFGNHELDWGADTLAARVQEAEFAWLGANIRVAGTDLLPPWSRATQVVTLPGCPAGAPACDSVRVGIIGIITSTTPETVLPSVAANFEFLDEATEIDRWVPQLRAQGVDFVIVVAHEGAYCDAGPAGPCTGPIIDIANRLQHPPDLIVSGHTRTVVATRANGIPIVSSGDVGSRISIVDLERLSENEVETTFTGQPITWVDEIQPDPGVVALIAQFEAQAGELMNRVVATLAEPLERSTGEFPLGNLVADSERAALDSDIAIMNTGGIRASLPAGDVRYEQVYEMLPFENRLVLLALSGADVRAAVEHALIGGRGAGHFSGLRGTYDPSAPEGARLVTLTFEGGEPIQDGATYTVAVNSFLAEGGDGYDMLVNGQVLHVTEYTDLDAFIAYLETLPSPIHAPEEQRFVPIVAPAISGER